MRASPKTKRFLKIALLDCLLIAIFLLWLRAPANHHIAPRTSPDFTKRPKNDAFVAAATAGNTQAIEKLLESGTNPNSGSTGGEGFTALSAAASKGHLSIVQLLPDKGADVNAEDEWGANALFSASQDGHVEIVELLLAHGADPNADADGETALDAASYEAVEHFFNVLPTAYPAIVYLLKSNGARFGYFNPLGWVQSRLP